MRLPSNGTSLKWRSSRAHLSIERNFGCDTIFRPFVHPSCKPGWNSRTSSTPARLGGKWPPGLLERENNIIVYTGVGNWETARVRDKNTMERNFVGWKTLRVYSGGEKMKNSSGRQCENERQWKKSEQKHTQYFRKFHIVVVQNNGKAMYKKVCRSPPSAYPSKRKFFYLLLQPGWLIGATIWVKVNVSCPQPCSQPSCTRVNHVNIAGVTCIKSIVRAHFCEQNGSRIQTK